MSKYVEKKISQIAGIVDDISTRTFDTVEQYNEARIRLNCAICELALGGEIAKSGDGFKMSFGKKMPSRTEIAQAFAVIKRFEQIEEGIISPAASNDVDDDEDMSITINTLPPLDKITRKKVSKAIFGDSGCGAIITQYLKAADFLELSAWGEKAQKHHRMKKYIIIASATALGLAGATVGGVFLYKGIHSHHHEDEIDETTEDIETTSDIDDMPEAVSLDDIPEEISSAIF